MDWWLKKGGKLVGLERTLRLPEHLLNGNLIYYIQSYAITIKQKHALFSNTADSSSKG